MREVSPRSWRERRSQTGSRQAGGGGRGARLDRPDPRRVDERREQRVRARLEDVSRRRRRGGPRRCRVGDGDERIDGGRRGVHRPVDPATCSTTSSVRNGDHPARTAAPGVVEPAEDDDRGRGGGRRDRDVGRLRGDAHRDGELRMEVEPGDVGRVVRVALYQGSSASTAMRSQNGPKIPSRASPRHASGRRRGRGSRRPRRAPGRCRCAPRASTGRRGRRGRRRSTGRPRRPAPACGEGDSDGATLGEARATSGSGDGGGAGDGPRTPAATTAPSSSTGTTSPTTRRTRLGRPLGPRDAGWTIMARPTVRARCQAGCGPSLAGGATVASARPAWRRATTRRRSIAPDPDGSGRRTTGTPTSPAPVARADRDGAPSPHRDDAEQAEHAGHHDEPDHVREQRLLVEVHHLRRDLRRRADHGQVDARRGDARPPRPQRGITRVRGERGQGRAEGDRERDEQEQGATDRRPRRPCRRCTRGPVRRGTPRWSRLRPVSRPQAAGAWPGGGRCRPPS